MSAENESDDELHCHGPYKLTYFEQWRGIFGIEALTDLDALVEDLKRWKRLIDDGRGEVASSEINEVLINFSQPSPVDKMFAGNRVFADSERR